MNEQEVADLFSKQVDRLLQGETPSPSSADGELQEVLGLAKQLSAVHFQASPTGQAAFQSQLGAWFGPENASTNLDPKLWRWNMMSGKLLVLIVSVLVVMATAVATIFIAVQVVVSSVFSGPPPDTPTPSSAIAPTVTADPSPATTAIPTETVTPTVTKLPTLPTAVDTIEDITVAVTVEIQIWDLVHGLPPGGDGDHDDHDGDHDDHDGDHNRGHGNDPDHHDEDNPGHGHK